MIDPRFISAVRWCSETGAQIQKYGLIPTIRKDSEWVDWARGVASLPVFSAVNVPWPVGFANWQAWALQFNLAAGALLTP